MVFEQELHTARCKHESLYRYKVFRVYQCVKQCQLHTSTSTRCTCSTMMSPHHICDTSVSATGRAHSCHIRDTNVSVSATGQSNTLETPVSQSQTETQVSLTYGSYVIETPVSQSPLRAKTTTSAHAARLEFSWRVTRHCPTPRSIKLGEQEHHAG